MKKQKSTKTGFYTNEYFKDMIVNQNLSTDWIKKELKNLIKTFDIKGPACDLGSSFGLFLKACEEMRIKATGIEGCSASVKWANQFTKNKTRQHDLAKKLPFKDKQFNLVHSSSVVEHLKPKIADQIIKESFRILKSDGLFICSCPNYFDFSERFEEHINLYTPTRLRRTLKKQGFIIKKEHLSFNLSLLTPWEKNRGKTGKLRLWVKKHSTPINIILAPIWIPIRWLNMHLLNWEFLDIFSGACFFVAKKN
jgi:SAM-dependent methyltransferase